MFEGNLIGASIPIDHKLLSMPLQELLLISDFEPHNCKFHDARIAVPVLYNAQ
jgi:hypothetical protein